jgi:lipoyl(octanoyl) transferase
VERRQLGRVEFDRAWELQRELARDVTPDRGFLLLLEHPPVFTLGKNGNEANILDPHGIPVRRIDRGGDVTYHGPGQLVGYPIVDLRRIGVRRFIRTLEDSVLDLLSGLGVRARRRAPSVGVWSTRGKIASIGVRVARGISMHGFSLNVSNDLTPFGYIHPCGEVGGEVTSVSLELGRPVALETAADRFRLRFWEAALNS